MITSRKYNPTEDIKTYNPNLDVKAYDLLERVFMIMGAVNIDQRITTACAFGLWVKTGVKKYMFEYEKMILDLASKADLSFSEKMVIFNFIKESCLVSDIKETRTYQTYNRRKLNPDAPQKRVEAGVTREDWFTSKPAPDYIVAPSGSYENITRYDFDVDKKVEDYIVGVLSRA